MKRKINEKIKEMLRNFWKSVRFTNIRIIGVPERKEKGPEKIFEGIFEHFPNLRVDGGSNSSPQVQRAP